MTKHIDNGDLKNMHWHPGVVVHTFTPSTQGERQANKSEFEINLVYTCSRTARVT